METTVITEEELEQEKEKDQVVFIVFSELEYSESGYTEDNVPQGSMGTVKSIVGIATSKAEVALLISTSHFQTLEDSGFNPIKYPWTVNDDDTYSVQIDGSVERTTFSNKLTWSALAVQVDSVVDIEL